MRVLPSCLQKGLPRQSLFSRLWFQTCNKTEELGRYVRGFFIDQLPKFVVRYFVTVFSGNNEQSSVRFSFQLLCKLFSKGMSHRGAKGSKEVKGFTRA